MKLTTVLPGEQPVPNPDDIPQILRDARRWLLWKDLPPKPRKDGTLGKRRKVPYYAVMGKTVLRNGTLDSPRDIARLVSYGQALAVLTAGGYAGLGFAVGGGYQGLDLDGCRDPVTGKLEPWAQEIVDRVATYIEVSPSGKGVHLIGYDIDGLTLRALAANGSGVEFYVSGRFFTFTGQTLGAPIVAKLTPVYDFARKRWMTAEEVKERATRTPQKPVVFTGQPSAEWPGFAAELRKKLRYVPCGLPRKRWFEITAGINLESGGNEEGFQIWHEWSAGPMAKADGSYTGEEDLRNQWERGFNRKDGVLIKWGTVQMYLDEYYPGPAPLPSPHKLPTSFTLDELMEMDIPATEWIVEGIIAPGLTLLTAPPKQGKSYLSLQMGMCVAGGVHFLGRATRACRVVYFDLEEWHGLLKERVAPIRAGNCIPKGVPLKIKLETGVGAEALKDMAQEIAEGAKLLIVDLLAKIRDEMNEDAKKNAYARDMQFIGALATFSLAHPGVAIVVVHHANKGNHDDWLNKVSGSAGVTGAAHTVLYLARPDLRGMSDEDKEHAMRYRVLHAVGKQVKAQDLTLEMMDAEGGWQVSGLKPWEIHATRKQMRIIAVLKQRAPEFVSSKEVADLLGLKPASVRQMMYQMGVQALIESDGRGGDGYRYRQAP